MGQNLSTRASHSNSLLTPRLACSRTANPERLQRVTTQRTFAMEKVTRAQSGDSHSHSAQERAPARNEGNAGRGRQEERRTRLGRAARARAEVGSKEESGTLGRSGSCRTHCARDPQWQRGRATTTPGAPARGWMRAVVRTLWLRLRTARGDRCPPAAPLGLRGRALQDAVLLQRRSLPPRAPPPSPPSAAPPRCCFVCCIGAPFSSPFG